ncbi:type II toxin-antitoxin system RelE/ParE family toxin [Acidihalobacter yilgarnensis]|uniref:type II toxin-antitoxin system RelE/ParE family toxin n=1 Tax=Acidihalobacter yilgarnensis TaxID=2819280 RepID=UPI0009F39948|nr:type II toxin-antitoxin system RelE/ParE family toxin [Acidihalobacter yilgarnensis]
MFTLIESPIFTRLWPDYWTEEERGEFAAWLAENPEAGDVVPGSGGVRKVRWSRAGQGKRGGVRVIYFCQTGESLIWLLTIYAKSRQENAPAHILRGLRQELIDGQE